MVVICAAIAGLVALLPGAPAQGADDAMTPIAHRGDQYVPKAPGTVETLRFYFGPYTVPPGHDANRVDLELPTRNGFILSIEPGMRRVSDFSEPSHQEAHIHHAHWFALDPGNPEDNYTYGNTEWIFGNGDEETKADFQERSAADKNGPVYGEYIGAEKPQIMIYMLHNKTSEPLPVYIALDVTFKHGTKEQLEAVTHRPHHDVNGVLFGRTYTVKRERNGDGKYETAKDDKRGPIEWTSTIDGTIIGTGGHLHPGGLNVIVENYGSKSNPCPDDGRGYGGTRLLKSEALFRHGKFSEDFQMSVSNPHWRAPIHKGDRIRISGTYENKDHGWYDVMTHEGLYIDKAQPPRGRCKPELINMPRLKWGGRTYRKKIRKKKVYRDRRGRRRVKIVKRVKVYHHVIVKRVPALKRVRKVYRDKKGRRRVRIVKRKQYVIKRWRDKKGRLHKRRKLKTKIKLIRVKRPTRDVTAGVPNRPWGHAHDSFCGEAFGGPPCERPERDRGPGVETNVVNIADFLYLPGDRALSGANGAPARIKRGTSLTFVNEDQQAGIRHSVTTCKWPCNGRYVANYPLPDGVWDSRMLGYDAIDGGQPNPVASTPSNLPVGKYSYFCRVHPWMRGAFEVTK